MQPIGDLLFPPGHLVLVLGSSKFARGGVTQSLCALAVASSLRDDLSHLPRGGSMTGCARYALVLGMAGSAGHRGLGLSHQTVRLSRGSHRGPEDGACVVELASLLSGEPFSDRPASVCPALRSFLHGYNDALVDHLRQDLYGLASDIVDTRSIARVTAWRARLCVGWGSSLAPLAGLSPVLGGSTLAQCTEAGIWSAQASRRVGWCHRQTLAFFRWLADARSPLGPPRQCLASPAVLPVTPAKPGSPTARPLALATR
jgi:hypothetical protein